MSGRRTDGLEKIKKCFDNLERREGVRTDRALLEPVLSSPMLSVDGRQIILENIETRELGKFTFGELCSLVTDHGGLLGKEDAQLLLNALMGVEMRSAEEIFSSLFERHTYTTILHQLYLQYTRVDIRRTEVISWQEFRTVIVTICQTWSIDMAVAERAFSMLPTSQDVSFEDGYVLACMSRPLISESD